MPHILFDFRRSPLVGTYSYKLILPLGFTKNTALECCVSFTHIPLEILFELLLERPLVTHILLWELPGGKSKACQGLLGCWANADTNPNGLFDRLKLWPPA